MSATHRQKLQAMLDDYADNAIVEDPLFERPIVGKQAIAQRKWAEMTSMSGVTIDVVHRFAHGNQVVAEWVVRGTHAGHFMGYAPTGRQIEIRGMTVVTGENGKITRESLLYARHGLCGRGGTNSHGQCARPAMSPAREPDIRAALHVAGAVSRRDTSLAPPRRSPAMSPPDSAASVSTTEGPGCLLALPCPLYRLSQGQPQHRGPR
jgi:steroid delta-isomerase-like uncharacterized protein